MTNKKADKLTTLQPAGSRGEVSEGGATVLGGEWRNRRNVRSIRHNTAALEGGVRRVAQRSRQASINPKDASCEINHG